MTNDERAREHMADLVRTRIKPGADPRAMWANSLATSSEGVIEMLRRHGEGLYAYEAESSPRSMPRLWSTGPELSRSVASTTRNLAQRYVPHDVRRWRDVEHRAAMAVRARAYAALQPEAKR